MRGMRNIPHPPGGGLIQSPANAPRRCGMPPQANRTTVGTGGDPRKAGNAAAEPDPTGGMQIRGNRKCRTI